MELCCFWFWLLQPSLVFGCALLSFTIGMHGGYFWRTKEAHRAWGRRCGIMVRGGAAVMIWGGWECITAEELAIKRLGGKFWVADCWGKKESCKGSGEVFLERACCWEGGRQIVLDNYRSCVDRGVDRLVWKKIGFVTNFFRRASSQPSNCNLYQEA
jgi:hypothetical protein